MKRAANGRWARDYVFDVLRLLEIEYIFGVPGTNEIPVIDGCDVPENGVSYVQCLHENIAMGAATGYARMTGKPGVVMLHVTPGVGHGIGNLFNAARSHTPLVVLCGQQQNELVTQEPLLASNLVEVARQYTKWAHEMRSWDEIPLVLQRAFKVALTPPCGPVFLSIPWEYLIRRIGDDDRIEGITTIPSRISADPVAVEAAAGALRASTNPVIVAGDGVGYSDAWPELRQFAELLGAPVYLEGLQSMANFPNDDYHWQGELPLDQPTTQRVLGLHDVAFLVGFNAQAQVTVFNYAQGPLIPKHVKQIYLHLDPWEIGKNDDADVAVLGDVKTTLPLLNAQLERTPPPGAPERNDELRNASRKRARAWQTYVEQNMDVTPIRGVVVAQALRELIEERDLAKRFVYVHEAISNGAQFSFLLPFGERYAQPTSYYSVEGGSLGYSMPASLGIKGVTEGRQGIRPDLVVNAVGDGSALFYPQVWWTAAHDDLSILYVIMNNVEYRTLLQGLVGVVSSYEDEKKYGWKPVTMDPEYLHIRKPDFDFVALAAAFGVTAGRRVAQPRDVKAALAEGIDHVLGKRGSYVLDIFTDPSVQPDVPPDKAPEPHPPLNAYYALKEGLF